MPGWEQQVVSDLSMFQATAITRLPGVVQGFTTRHGGVSAPPYDSLNLGTRVGDSPDAVQANRKRVWHALGFSASDVALAEQVHGDQVAAVKWGGMMPGADALITDRPGVLLMLLYADCVPVYIVDPAGRSLGLAHAGWRGAAANIVGKTVAAMRDAYGGTPANYLAAVGPCIGTKHYEVGDEVANRFRLPGETGHATASVQTPGKAFLDLRGVIASQLLAAGLRHEAVAICDADTCGEKAEFFSHRRDGAMTGRMAAVFALRETGSEGTR